MRALHLNVWEVIDAAATKPYGFMRSTRARPGRPLPADRSLLSVLEGPPVRLPTEFIELAGKVNTHMPYYCAERIARALNEQRKPVSGSRVLLLGVSYKSDVGDLRESPALRLIELLRGMGAELGYHDPHVPELAHHGSGWPAPTSTTGRWPRPTSSASSPPTPRWTTAGSPSGRRL